MKFYIEKLETRSIVRCKICFDILKRVGLGVVREYNGRTHRQTNRQTEPPLAIARSQQRCTLKTKVESMLTFLLALSPRVSGVPTSSSQQNHVFFHKPNYRR